MNCKLCDKEIWAIVKTTERIGVEKPVYLHAVCYERLQRSTALFNQELEKAVEGFL